MIIKNISKRERLLFIATSVVILLLLCYNFLVIPTLKKIKQLNVEISGQEVKLKKLKQLLLEKNFVFDLYNESFKNVKITASSEEEAVAQLLANVESLARQDSVLINDVKPKPVKPLDSFKIFNFDLEIDGSINNLTKFIYDLENSPESIRIERLQISAKTGKSDVLKAELSIARLAIQ